MNPLSPAEYRFILRRELMSFNERAFYELNPMARLHSSPYIEVMVSKLEQIRLGKITRLIINVPPRSLKSHTASVAFPAWLFGHDPSLRIVCASYGQDLADKLARESRTLMMSRFYHELFPETRLSREKSSVSHYETTAQGYRLSTSVEGALTGFGGDVIIIDDPVKPEDALSDTRRENVNDWYDNTLVTRLNNKVTGAIIIVMQRLHQDDLVGHVLEAGGWDVLSFPAIAEEDEAHLIETPLGRRLYKRIAGEVLDPARENLITLNNLRETVGEYTFLSQYQQSPIPVGGAMVKSEWFRYYEPNQLPARFSCVLQSWDTANKAGDLNDYSVCTTWGVYNSRYYLLNVFRQRVNFPQLKRAVHDQARVWNPHTIVIEDKASGTQLIQTLRAEGLFNVKSILPPPSTDKQIRLHAQTADFEAGRVILPRTAPWLDDYKRELTTFPGSKYDDQVDSTTQALEHFKNHSPNLELWARLGRG